MCPLAEIPLRLPNRSHQRGTAQGMDPARRHSALSHLTSPLNSLPLCCTTASIAFQQWYHTDVWLGGSSDVDPAPKYHQFPLHSPTPSSVFKNFQQRGFDNRSHNLFHGFIVPIPTDSIFFLMSDFLSCRSTISSSLLKMGSIQLLSFTGFLKGLLLPNLPKRQLLPNLSSCLRSRKLFVGLPLSLNQKVSKMKPIPASIAPLSSYLP